MTDERRYKPDFDTPCPWVPEGATDWETQEITFRWRSALGYIDSARHILVDYAERLVRYDTAIRALSRLAIGWTPNVNRAVGMPPRDRKDQT